MSDVPDVLEQTETIINNVVAILRRAGVPIPADALDPGVFAVPATGRIPDVVDGQVIESAWGNGIRDRSVPFFNSVAEAKADTLSMQGLVKFAGGDVWPCWRWASAGPWRSRRDITTATVTTDASGIVTYTAAQVGFTTLEGAMCGVSWGAAVGTPWLAQARLASNQLQMRVMNVLGGGTISAAVSTGVILHYSVWGQL